MCTCTAQIIQKLPGSFPTSESAVPAKVSPSPHFRQGQNSRNILQEPCDVFWKGLCPGHKVSTEAESSAPAPQRELYRQTTPLGGALLGSFPHPALNSSNRHLWSLPGAGFTQKPVTHSLISGSPEQVLCPGVRKPAPWRPSSWEACGRLWPGSRVLVVGLRSSSPSALYPGSFGGEPSRVGTPMVGLCWFPRLVGQNNLRRTLEGVGFSSIITNVCAILYFTNKILKSCGSNKGTFLWARP